MEEACRSPRGSILAAGAAFLVAALCYSASLAGQPAAPGSAFVDEAGEPVLDIVDVIVEGNRTIETGAITAKIKVQPGPFSAQVRSQMRKDMAALTQTRWFVDVGTVFRKTDEGYVLVYRVVERPIIRSVRYQGNDKIKTRDLQALTNLQQGGAYDAGLNRRAALRIQEHYKEKGFAFATVELESGSSPEDRDVIFRIDEGKKVYVMSIRIRGSEYIGERRLKTQLRTKQRLLWVWGGQYDPTTIADDIASLKQYYHGLGFFDVEVEEEREITKDRSKIRLTYHITEGPQYKIRNVIFTGTDVIDEDKLRGLTKLKEGDAFNEKLLQADVATLRKEYGILGRIFAKVDPTPRFEDEAGTLDVIYNIDEGKIYYIRKVDVVINGDNPVTKETVVLNRLLFRPGDLADPEKIRRSQRRLEGSQLFATLQTGQPPRIELQRVESSQAQERSSQIIRAQGFQDDFPPVNNPIFSPNPQGDPFGQSLAAPPDYGFIDPLITVSETQTGRVMVGFGLNSDNGVVGNFVLDERNFDLFRPPHSVDDVWNGLAWRGGGQQFRVEAIPGNRVSRYLLNWRDPYFMEQDLSLGVSGFYFTRIYDDWDETRIGGRVSFGKQFNDEVSASVALRLEDVEISNIDFPIPPDLAAVQGNNFLSTIRFAVAHDTRDAAFLPSEGHYLEFAFEQAFGDFTYPRLELSGSQYYQLGQRPDGSGRQVLTLQGELGWTDSDTPVFERFYAGGSQSFRGFRFRGITPRVGGIEVGGAWLAVGSVEYMHPITANDALQGVVFTDFGSVEESVAFQDFRVSVGFGIRITVPALGPVPLALDWAIPLADEPGDEKRTFSFTLGIAR